MIYLAEITAAIDAAGTTTTLRFSSEGFITEPTEAPANAYFEERITQPASMRRDMFSGGTSGQSRVGYGEMILSNADGGLDYVKDFGFDGRDCVIRVGEPDAAYPAGFTTAVKGAIDQATLQWNTLSFRLRDRLVNFDKPLLTTRYAGTNALPNGLEGTAQDLKGKIKPRCYGQVFNVSPPCVNTSKLAYQLSDGALADIPAVYDQGVPIARGADYANSALLLAAAPAPGTYITCLAEGFFRLGSSPVGPVTSDATQGANSAARTTAQVIKKIALDMGIAGGDISAGDVTALDAANSAPVGIWISDDVTALAAMDPIAASVGAWYGFDRLGMLRMGRLVAPAGMPAAVLDITNIKNIERVVATSDTDGLPTWRVTVNYAKNWTVISSGLAGAVSADRRAWLALERRASIAADATVKNQYLLAQELTRDTLLALQADADAETARLLNLFKSKRETYNVTVRLSDQSLVASLDLGVVVSVVHYRFGLSLGKLFIITGIEADLALNRLELTLWG